jgi:hypothetical protein
LRKERTILAFDSDLIETFDREKMMIACHTSTLSRRLTTVLIGILFSILIFPAFSTKDSLQQGDKDLRGEKKDTINQLLQTQIRQRLQSALNTNEDEAETAGIRMNDLVEEFGEDYEGGDDLDDDEMLSLDTQEGLSNGEGLRGLIRNRLSSRSSSADQSDFAILLQQKQRTSFDCWKNIESSCESQYCLWKDGQCTISPAAFYLICETGCEAALCVQLPPNVPPGSMVCPVKATAIKGLCPTIQNETNCGLQMGLCNWSPKTDKCVTAYSCCGRAQSYCQMKKKRQQRLKLALKYCKGFATNKHNLCSFWRNQC